MEKDIHSVDNNTQEIIVDIINLNMRFNLTRERTDTLKEYLIKLIKGKLFFDEFYALKEINLTIKKGEALAVVGLNGSGKSTLLKCIAGILSPSSGTITVNGSVAPLIELGAGFDMELTARENIYLNGAVLGHDRSFMNDHFKNIVEFAELEEFIDVPLKNYSSGMIARLGFSIATEISAEILIIDEILAVGDYAFQQKCKERIANMLNNGTTLILVSHNAEQVIELCEKAIWLQHGKIVDIGKASEIVGKYQQFR